MLKLETRPAGVSDAKAAPEPHTVSEAELEGRAVPANTRPVGRIWALEEPVADEQPGLPRSSIALGAAIMLALGGILYAAWPDDAPSVSNERAEQLAAVDAQGALPGSPQTVPSETLAAADAGPIVGAGLSPEEEAAMAGDADAAATSLSDWFNAGGAVAGLANTPATAAIKPVPLGDTAATPISGEQAVAATGTGAPASPQSPAAAPTAETTAPSTVSGPSAGSVTVTEAPRVQAAMPVVPTRPQNGVVPAPAPALSSQPRWIKGGPKDSDNRRGQYQGDVLVQFTVQPNGRVSNCGTFRSSGNPQLDAMTCRVVTDRARFVPARDVRGRPVPTRVSVSYHWGKGPRLKR